MVLRHRVLAAMGGTLGRDRRADVADGVVEGRQYGARVLEQLGDPLAGTGALPTATVDGAGDARAGIALAGVHRVTGTGDQRVPALLEGDQVEVGLLLRCLVSLAVA